LKSLEIWQDHECVSR